MNEKEEEALKASADCSISSVSTRQGQAGKQSTYSCVDGNIGFRVPFIDASTYDDDVLCNVFF
jgi:hypothetical protein